MSATGPPGGSIPAGAALMLHAWDMAGKEQLMMDGEVGPEGVFRFDEVPMQEGWVFAVMLNYLGATYSSEPVVVQAGMEEITLPVTVFEATDDDSRVRVDSMHVIFAFGQGGLAVSELYIVSNTGDRAVAGAASVEGGQGSLAFPLPDGAANVTFQGAPEGRFAVMPGSFVDTFPLLPGEGTGQIFLTYALAYESGMTYRHEAGYPVQAVNLLAPEGSGLSITGPRIEVVGSRTFQTGDTFELYRAPEMAPGDVLEVTLSGETTGALPGQAGEMSAPTGFTSETRSGLLIGIAALGLALIGTGIWWWRRPSDVGEEPAEDWPEALAGVLKEVSALDKLYDRGKVDEQEYVVAKGALWDRALSALSQAKEPLRPRNPDPQALEGASSTHFATKP